MFTEYTLQVWEKQNDLSQEIIYRLNNGWSLYGNPFAIQDENGKVSYCQAMVR